MKNGHVEKEDGIKLMSMYAKFDIDGTLREPLTPDEMVLLFCIAKAIKEGKVC